MPVRPTSTIMARGFRSVAFFRASRPFDANAVVIPPSWRTPLIISETALLSWAIRIRGMDDETGDDEANHGIAGGGGFSATSSEGTDSSCSTGFLRRCVVPHLGQRTRIPAGVIFSSFQAQSTTVGTTTNPVGN